MEQTAKQIEEQAAEQIEERALKLLKYQRTQKFTKGEFYEIDMYAYYLLDNDLLEKFNEFRCLELAARRYMVMDELYGLEQ